MVFLRDSLERKGSDRERESGIFEGGIIFLKESKQGGGISVTGRKGVSQFLVVYDFRFFTFITIFYLFPDI